jgi:hypothetical protein
MKLHPTYLLIPVAAATLLLGCGERAGEQTISESPATAAVRAGNPAPQDIVMADRRECVNPPDGYAVAYPAGWRTNTGEILPLCSVFHPGEFRIPPASELPAELAISIGFEEVPFATLTGEMLGRREISRRPVRVDGREGVAMLSESTGEGLHDAGLRAYQFFVDLGATTMVATTYDVGEPDFERRRRILDAMMASFDFREPSPSR